MAHSAALHLNRPDQDHLAPPPPPEITPKVREKLEGLWDSFGWSDIPELFGLLESHPQEMAFLYKSKLLFSIRGYQNSLKFSQAQYGRVFTPQEEALYLGIMIDHENQPMILAGGNWVRCSEVQDLIEFNPELKIITSKNDPSVHWDYTYPNGLVQINAQQIVHTYKVCPQEMEKLQEISQPPQDQEERPRHFFQIFTDGRVSHVACRLIKDNGDVYSIGLGVVPGEPVSPFDNLTGFLSTYNGAILCPDYKEMATFETRKVTTLAINQEKFEELLQLSQEYAEDENLRFQFMRQNCVRFASHLLRTISPHEDPKEMRTVIQGGLEVFFPEGFESVPYIGSTCAKIEAIAKPIIAFLVSYTPQFALDGFDWIVYVIFFIPNKALIAIQNTVFLCLGAGNAGRFPLTGDTESEGSIDNQDRLTSFNQLITWRNFFSDHVGLSASPIAISDWQDSKGASTFTVDYQKGAQMFHIVPARGLPAPVVAPIHDESAAGA